MKMIPIQLEVMAFNYIVVLEVQNKKLVAAGFKGTESYQDWVLYVGPDFDAAKQVYANETQTSEQKKEAKDWIWYRKFLLKVPYGEITEGLLNEETLYTHTW